MANTGSGEKVVARRGGQNMAENSETSPKSGKRLTRQINVLTQDQALEILQQSLLECQKAGIDVIFIPKFYSSGEQLMGILLANVQLINGNLVLINGNGD